MVRFMEQASGRRRRGSLFFRSALASLGLVALGATDADAQTKIKPGENKRCELPVTADNCRQESFRQCNREIMAQCTTILRSGFQSSFSSGTSLPRYQDLDDTNAIVAGKTQKRAIDANDVHLSGGLLSLQGRDIRAVANAQKVTPSPSYTREPSWTLTPAIESCDEYVFEKYYKYMRFLDAASTCKGDDNCIVDMAGATYSSMGVPQRPPPRGRPARRGRRRRGRRVRARGDARAEGRADLR